MTITLHGSVAEMVQKQVSIGSYQSAEDLVYEALELLIKHKIDKGVNEGIADIKAGHSMELRIDNIEEVLSKPILQW
jgi:Arc/MetJ-type ribon-helix-helix transcriptional regulator